MRMLIQGNRNRTQEPTAANQVSSRSHAVLQVHVEQREKAPGVKAQVRIGERERLMRAHLERPRA